MSGAGICGSSPAPNLPQPARTDRDLDHLQNGSNDWWPDFDECAGERSAQFSLRAQRRVIQITLRENDMIGGPLSEKCEVPFGDLRIA